MNWLLIIIAIVIVLMFLKFRHVKHRTFAIIIILLLAFFYVSYTKVMATQNLDLKSLSGIDNAARLYFSWLYSAGINVKALAGNAIHMDWGIKTNSSSPIDNSGAEKIG